MSAGNGKKPAVAEMRAGPRGGLLRVGNPGNKGGTGQPPSAIRQRCRGSFYDRIRILEDIADGAVPLTRKCPKCGHKPPKDESSPEAAGAGDRIRAIDLLGHYGLEVDKGVSAADVRQRLGRTIDIIRESLEPEKALELLDALRPVWA